MPDMQLFSVLVAIGGGDKMIVPPTDRGWGQGVVSGPEIEVLRMLHGQGSVRDIKPFDEAETPSTTTKREKARLAKHYDPKVVEQVFPGMNPQMTLSPALDEILDEGAAFDEDDEDEPPPAPRPARAPAKGPDQVKAERLGGAKE